MAIVFVDGFDHYGGEEADMVQGIWSGAFSYTLRSTSGGGPRTGDYYLDIGRSGIALDAMQLSFDAQTTFGIATGLRVPDLPSAAKRRFIEFLAGGTEVVTLDIASNGAINIRDGDVDGSIIATSSKRLIAGTFHHIEFKVDVSPTNGTAELRLDGVAVAAVSAINFGSSGIDQIVWTNVGTSDHMHFDDMVIWNADGSTANDFLGPVRVTTVYPEADVSSIPGDWDVTGAGSGAEAINDVPADDDTSYISASDPGYRATFAIGELPAEIDEIIGVHVMMRAKQSDAGVTSIRAKMQSYTEEEIGDTHQLTLGYVYYNSPFTLDPNGDIQWTPTTLEAAILEIERVD